MKPRKPPRPRNPVALDLITNPLYRTKIERSDDEKRRQCDDAWDRGRKHKGMVERDDEMQ